MWNYPPVGYGQPSNGKLPAYLFSMPDPVIIKLNLTG